MLVDPRREGKVVKKKQKNKGKDLQFVQNIVSAFISTVAQGHADVSRKANLF